MKNAADPVRIALISATPKAIGPAEDALSKEFAGAEAWNLLDDRLMSDADERGGVDDALTARMQRLISYAAEDGADGILVTCSLYAAVAQRVRLAIPVLAPDEAAIDELIGGGFGRVLVVASFEQALTDSVARVRAALSAAASSTEVVGVFVPAALEATSRDDLAGLESALSSATRMFAGEVDAVFLAQYSLAPAGPALAGYLGLPVLSGPLSSARRLRQTILRDGERSA